MSARILLCADSQSCLQPSLIGLDGELLDAQEWIDVVQTGEEARRILAEGRLYDEIWVVSSDDVDAINLAATLKADAPGVRILLAGDGDGSMRSRAYTAAIDEVASMAEFVESYCQKKACVREYRPSKDASADSRIRPLHVRPGEEALLRSNDQASSTHQAEEEPLNIKGRGFLIPVVSGSGGVGKSTVSTLAALIAHRAGYRTLLLDFDLQFGDVAEALGVTDALSVDEIVSHPEIVERLSAMGGLPAIVKAPDRVETADALVAEASDLMSLLRSRFDVIIANTGAAWAEHHATILEQSNIALFLIDQRASSLRACKHALQLCSRCGIASRPFRFALNRCSRNALFTSIDVSCALRGATVFELRDGGPTVEEYFASGSALQLVEEGNELCVSLTSALSRLLPEGEQKLEVLSSDLRQKRGAKRRGRRFLRGGEGS